MKAKVKGWLLAKQEAGRSHWSRHLGQRPLMLLNDCLFIHHLHSLLCQREVWVYSESE